jgi:hypothetical protein
VVLSPAVRTIGFAGVGLLSRLPAGVSSGCERRLSDAGDCPDKADHFAGDRGGDHDLRLAGRSQTAIPRAQPQLGFPGERADCPGLALLPQQQLAAEPCWEAVGPSRLDQQPAGRSVARFGMPPRLTLAPLECSHGTSPR